MPVARPVHHHKDGPSATDNLTHWIGSEWTSLRECSITVSSSQALLHVSTLVRAARFTVASVTLRNTGRSFPQPLHGPLIAQAMALPLCIRLARKPPRGLCFSDEIHSAVAAAVGDAIHRVATLVVIRNGCSGFCLFCPAVSGAWTSGLVRTWMHQHRCCSEQYWAPPVFRFRFRVPSRCCAFACATSPCN